MPKLAPLDEWLAPWETATGETEIDKGRLKRYLHGLLGDKERLQESVATITEERDGLKKAADEKAREGETDVQRLEREKKELEAKLAEKPAETAEVLKLRVALDKGLTSDQASRLIGGTLEELTADADVLLKSFGIEGTTDGGDGTDRGEPRRAPRGRMNPGDPTPEAGASVDVKKALDSGLVPRVR